GVRGPFLGPPPTDEHTTGGVRGPFLGPRYQMTTDIDTTAESQGLTVRVESFVGPLDLLLHLCRTNEVDLANLPIRAITEQYLAHLESVQFQDLETAGALMVMAATLIYLKSKLLLPPDPDAPPDELDEEGDLLRQDLAERLREYARGKTLGAGRGAGGETPGSPGGGAPAGGARGPGRARRRGGDPRTNRRRGRRPRGWRDGWWR